MSVNKTPDTRENSVTPKNDLEDSQLKEVDKNRRNAGGYSWWKWRRSTDSADKKSLPKDIDSKESKQNIENVNDEMKEVINDLEHLSLPIGNPNKSNEDSIEEHIEPQIESEQNLSVDNADATAKNDDSISSELADKSSFCNEKYRKTLRLTSDQIVRKTFFYSHLIIIMHQEYIVVLF